MIISFPMFAITLGGYIAEKYRKSQCFGIREIFTDRQALREVSYENYSQLIDKL